MVLGRLSRVRNSFYFPGKKVSFILSQTAEISREFGFGGALILAAALVITARAARTG